MAKLFSFFELLPRKLNKITFFNTSKVLFLVILQFKRKIIEIENGKVDSFKG